MEKLSAYLSRLQDGDNEIGSKSLRGNIVQTGGIVKRGSDFNADRKFNLHCGPGRCPCTRQGYIESKLVTSGRAVKRAKRARVFHNRTSTVYRDLGEGKECSLNPLPQVSWLGRSKDERR